MQHDLNKQPQSKEQRPRDLAAKVLKLDGEGMGLTAIARELSISRGSVYGILTKAKAKGVVGQ